ncbi:MULTISPECIES: hypothetical protein [unclassified Flavobacterium]|uniref:hypothetical protein n=1 Tax=unclassified Flavobacterium TaxID=196869 RepID=UPI001F1446D3|nr:MULTISPECIES: hypothetical protein [unclassified Flavobacterium]UMY66256.1 hypothetical protein MKO97_02430 [Flavobacterium sp. HJ-32-4]
MGTLRHKTVPAFSVFEVIIALVVTAIVVSLVFVLFDIVGGRLRDLKTENEKTADLNRLCFLLNRDVFDATSLRVSDSVATFGYASADSARYRGTDRYLIREQRGYVDTFHLAFRGFRSDTLRNAQRTTCLQRIRIRADINDRKETLSFFRTLFPDILLNRDSL